MKIKIPGIIVFLCLASRLVYSQHIGSDTTKTIRLNQVEIVGSTDFNAPLSGQLPSQVKLTTTEINRGTGLYLDDAINTNVPGVFMERRTTSAGQQFNIRGYGNGVRGSGGVSSNFDGQGYKVYLNGIPITDAEGITLMDDIDFGSIGKVDVLKGPAGTLYGLAIAGAVSLQTKKAEKGKLSVGQNAMFGSYGLRRLTTTVEMGGEHSSLLINYGNQKLDGFAVHTASRKDFVNVMGDFQPNEKQTITSYFGYSNSYDERQGQLSLTQWDKSDYSGNAVYIKNDGHSNVISVRAGIGHTYRFNKYISNSLSVFGSGVSSNVSSAGGWTDKNPMNYGTRCTFDMKFSLSDKFQLSGITGGEFQQQYAQTIGHGMILNPSDPNGYNIIGAMRSNMVTRSTTSSLFTQWTLGMPEDFSITAGIGINNMQLLLNDRFYVAGNKKPVQYSKSYDNLLSPHISLNKVFHKKITTYLSYSTGHKAPVSSYFYIPVTGIIYDGLVPEKGDQFEIGASGSLLHDKLTFQVALFNTIFSRKMTTVAVPLNPPAVGTEYSYVVNRGSQKDKGLEVLLKYTAWQSENFLKEVKPFVNFCYSDFKYAGYTFQELSDDKKSVVERDYSGNAVAGVAPVTANAGVDMATNIGMYGNINYSYRDAMPFTSDGVNKTQAYGVLNAKIGFHKTFIRHFDVDVSAGAVNMTNTKYAYMVFLNQIPDSFVPAPPKINFFGGINLKYIF